MQTLTVTNRYEQLIERDEPGGVRHVLDGVAIHCGDELELGRMCILDDGARVLDPGPGFYVRYEASWSGPGAPRVTLYVDAGGHTFTSTLRPGMLFRWPVRR